MMRIRTKGVMERRIAGRKVRRVSRKMMVTEVESPRTLRPGIWMTGAFCAAIACSGSRSTQAAAVRNATAARPLISLAKRIRKFHPGDNQRKLRVETTAAGLSHPEFEEVKWTDSWLQSGIAPAQLGRWPENAS